MNFEIQHEAIKKDIDNYLKTVFEGSNAPIELLKAMEYSLFSNGKRLRPVIVLHMARELGVADSLALPLCAGIEMIHTYSLIHDDLPAMDNDDYRRGLLTSHKKLGEDMAILAGDGLLNSAFELMLQNVPEENFYEYLNAVKYIVNCAGVEGMIGGQVLDIKNITGDIDDLKKMHGLKTGKLFSACIMSMVFLSNANDEAKNSYLEFSKTFGLLFQITDDILDVIGNKESLGKTIGKDEALGKVTYVTKYGLDKACSLADEAMQMCLSLLDKTNNEHSYLRQLVLKIREREK